MGKVSLYYLVYHFSRYINKDGKQPTNFDDEPNPCTRDEFLTDYPMIDVVNNFYIQRHSKRPRDKAIFACLYCPDCKAFPCLNCEGGDKFDPNSCHAFAPIFIGQEYGAVYIDDAHAGNHGFTVANPAEWRSGKKNSGLNRLIAAELHGARVSYEFTATCESTFQGRARKPLKIGK